MYQKPPSQFVQQTSNPAGGAQQQQGQIKIIGNYQYNIRYCLGEGAYGKVYEGTETKTNKKIAIKKMDIKSFEKDTYLKNQIIAEIEILKRFNHGNIVQFIDLITTQRSLYIITEFCKNGDLRQLMQQKRLQEDNCIKIMKHLIEGFKELIKHNVIHRDLKPANILVHEGIFKIADFGFAKFVDYSSQQMLRSCVGSPLYMAPQILQRKQYGTKCDIWSLGVIFHEMVFGDVPWKARDERELLNNIMNNPYRIRPGAKVQKFTETLLKSMLVVDENKRISWEKLFEMFKGQEQPQKMSLLRMNSIGNKENKNSFYQNSNNTSNTGINVNLNANANEQNKIRKSIFDKPEAKTTLNNIMLNKQHSLDPFQQPKLSQQQSLPTQQPQQISKSQMLRKEISKQFSHYNQIRSEIVFRHFVSVDLLNKMIQHKTLIKTELVFERFLIVLSYTVKQQSHQLLKQIKDLEIKNEDIFKMSPEIIALKNSIFKENDYYKQFFNDLQEQFDMQGILENLKSEPEQNFMLQEIFSEFEMQKLEQRIHNCGKDVCQELLREIKISKLEENLRGGILSVDYIIDIILSKKKFLKGQEVNFELLHSEKSEKHDLKQYLDKINSKMSLFQTTFNFF